MPLYPIFFLIVVLIGWLLSLFSSPYWGLLTYIFVYFNIPTHHWWGIYVPSLRWSLASAIILAISVLFRFNRYRIISPFSIPFLRFLLLLLILMLFIVPLSVNPQVAFLRCYDFFRYIVIFYFAYLLLSTYKEIKIYLLFWILLVVYLCYLAHHYFTGTRLERVGPVDAAAANEFAILLATTVPFCMYFLLRETKIIKIFSLISLVVILDTFSMCRSRGAFLGLGAGILYASLFFPVQKYRFISFLSSLSVLICLFYVMDPLYFQRLLSLKTDTTGAGRLEIWSYGIKMVKDHPFGIGGDGFKLLSPFYLPSRLLEHNLGIRASHNTYLMVLVEQGLLGLFFYLLAIFDLLQTSLSINKYWNKAKVSNRFQVDLLFLNFFATVSFFSFLVSSFFCDRLYYEGYYLLTVIIPVISKIINYIIDNEN